METLSGRSAIVTGGASGIGQAIAVAFAARGAKVLVADIAAAEETIRLGAEKGAVIRAVRCDVSSQDEVAGLMRSAQEQLGAVDILVNNAGIYPFAPVESMPVELWDRVFAVNVRSMFLCCAAVIPGMRSRGGGKIINLASTIFFVGVPAAAAYVASKGAVIGLSRSLARELGDHNIQVNVLTPGLCKTPGVDTMGMPDDFFDAFVGQQSIRRIGRPQDLVGAALFLASGASDFITGQIINVDGGLIAH